MNTVSASPKRETPSRKKVIGWQILNSDGFNIHGEEDDPFSLTSFSILNGKAVNNARAWVSQNPAYNLAPVYDGDIERPEFVDLI